MTAYSSTITLDGNSLEITASNPIKVPATVKQIVGKNIVKHQVPGRAIFDWQISYTGVITSEIETVRDNLYSLQDNMTVAALVDGKHDGNYLIESLSFDDGADNVSSKLYRFTITLIQYQQ